MKQAMFRRIKQLLNQKAHQPPPMPVQPYSPNREQFSFESLWNDLERRTCHYGYVQQTLGRTDPRLLNWIGSIDQSGYTRESCLRALIANFVPGDENRILLRLADWVPQIQLLAREWTIEHIASLPLEAICANQRLLLYLTRKDRLQSDTGLHAIKRDLLERTRSMALSKFFCFTAMFRRFLFSLSLSEDGHLRCWILDDPDPFNRLLLLNKVDFSALTKEEIERLGTDKSVFVRRRFFHTQLDAGFTPSKANLISLALDHNRSLRELGQFYLKKIYQEDAYAIYRAKGGEELFFVADYGHKEDSELFLDGIRSGSRSTQYNCLRALVSTAQERLEELDLAALIAQNRRFRAVLLPVLPQLLSLDAILALRPAFEGNSPCGTASFLRVLEKKSFWAFVDEGLDVLLADAPPVIRQSIVRTIQGRVQIYESPSTRRRESISKKIARLRSDPRKQNEAMTTLLEFMLKTT
jgi:hypothetical protein